MAMRPLLFLAQFFLFSIDSLVFTHRWEENYIDINSLVKKLLTAERENRRLREEITKMKRAKVAAAAAEVASKKKQEKASKQQQQQKNLRNEETLERYIGIGSIIPCRRAHRYLHMWPSIKGRFHCF